MRINVYAEELTQEVEVVSKAPANHPGVSFYGVRMYLASPSQLHHNAQDDDRSAITIWVPWTKEGGHAPQTVSGLLRTMADRLDEYTTVQYPPTLTAVEDDNGLPRGTMYVDETTTPVDPGFDVT